MIDQAAGTQGSKAKQ